MSGEDFIGTRNSGKSPPPKRYLSDAPRTDPPRPPTPRTPEGERRPFQSPTERAEVARGEGGGSLGSGGGVFYQMKSRDTFAPMGPFIVTSDEVANPQNLNIKLSINGDLKQNFNTDDMAHQIPRVIEWVTSIHTLNPGDVVATGTNHRGLTPIMDGDRIELETEGLGKLHIGVRDTLGRKWERETRLDRQDQGFDTPTPQISGKYS